MRLASYIYDGRPGWGAVEGDRIAPLYAHWPDLRTALEAGIDRIAVQAGQAAGTIPLDAVTLRPPVPRSEEHTSELQSLMRISYAVFCLKKKNKYHTSTARHKFNT